MKKWEKFRERERERESLATKINNRLSKASSVRLKMAEDRLSKRNNSIRDKESLVQSINVDIRYITDNRLQCRKKEEEERKITEEKKEDEITVDNFNSGKCSYPDVTRGTTESKSVFDLSVIYL